MKERIKKVLANKLILPLVILASIALLGAARLVYQHTLGSLKTAATLYITDGQIVDATHGLYIQPGTETAFAVTNQALTDAIGSDSGIYIRKATTPTIYNVTMTTENIEYSQALPSNCLKFLAQCRTSNDVRLAFTANGTYSTYLTIFADSAYCEDHINLTNKTLYFQCASAGKIMEIITWE